MGIQNDVLFHQLSYLLLCSFYRCFSPYLMLVIVRIYNTSLIKRHCRNFSSIIASGVFLCVTILNIVVIGGINIYFSQFLKSLFLYIAFIGLYLSSFLGIVSYFPDRYVNAVVIGTVGVNYIMITYQRLNEFFIQIFSHLVF